MKTRVAVFFLFLLSLSGVISCASIFSPLSPGDPSAETRLDVLLAMGDRAMSDVNGPTNYQRAFYCYRRALQIAPRSTDAVSGLCASYLYSRIPLSNYFAAVYSQDLSGIPDGFRTLADVSGFISSNLLPFCWTNGSLAGTNNLNLLIEFGLFENLSAVLSFVDLDGDSVLENDPDDLFTFTGRKLNPPSLMNRFFTFTNDFGGTLRLLSRLPAKVSTLSDRLSRASNAMGYVLTNTRSLEMVSYLSNVTDFSARIRSAISVQLSRAEIPGGGLTNLKISGILLLAGSADVSVDSAPGAITNFLKASGITNSNQLLSVFADLGVYAPPSVSNTIGNGADVLVNMFPDFASVKPALAAALTNYFQ